MASKKSKSNAEKTPLPKSKGKGSRVVRDKSQDAKRIEETHGFAAAAAKQSEEADATKGDDK